MSNIVHFMEVEGVQFSVNIDTRKLLVDGEEVQTKIKLSGLEKWSAIIITASTALIAFMNIVNFFHC